MANDRKASLLNEAAEMAMNHPSKGAKAFACAVSDYLASHTGEAEPVARYSFVCNAGCGVCAVKVAPFEYERTETIEGEHLGSKYQPQIVSSCCGAEVHVYDNEADHWGAEVTLAATPAAPGEVTLNKKDLNKLLNDFARACAFGDDLLARMATSKAIHEYLDAAFAALSNPAPVAAPAPVPYDKHEAEILAVIDERDRYHDMADQLAAQIAAITGDEIGEHSSDNDPWRNAMLSADEWIARDLRAMFAGEAEPRRRIAAPAPASEALTYQGPKKFTAEEITDGCIGIRWVTAEGVQGRPSSHDVMEYLKRDKGALCSCKQCAAFFPMLATPSPGDSADAPVQLAGEAFPGDLCLRCYGSGKDPAPEVGRADALKALQEAHRLGFLRAAGWVQRDDLFADVSSPAYRKDRDHDLAALKGEQPEPSGGERGEV